MLKLAFLKVVVDISVENLGIGLSGLEKGGSSAYRQKELMDYKNNKIYWRDKVSTNLKTLEKYKTFSSRRIATSSSFAAHELYGLLLVFHCYVNLLQDYCENCVKHLR
jgi:hypothetical protein